MVSSVPKFPAKKSSGYNYLDNQTIYGQTILCVTVAKAVENDLSIHHKITLFWELFLVSLFLKSFLNSILVFFLVENIYGTTHPYIYDKTNFDVNAINRPSKSHVGLKSHGNVQLKVLAKSAAYKEGDTLKCLFENI